MLFKRLLLKVTKGTVLSFNNRLYKQVDGCGMGNPLSPVLANIFMSKLEDDIVSPNAPSLYHRYVDDCIAKRKKGQPDELLEELNSYHPNIKFTVQDNPSHFLDTVSVQRWEIREISVQKTWKNPHTLELQDTNQMEKKLNNGGLAQSETNIKQPCARHQRNTH